MTLSEVARVTGLSPAVARRCLLTLVELGYVGKDNNEFLLRPAVLELSTPFIESFNIENVIRPPLQQLRNATEDSSSFAVLSQSDVLYITHVSTYRVIRLQATTGTRFPALVTSMGRAILSQLPEGDIDSFLYRYPLSPYTEKTTTDSGQLKRKILEARERGYAIVSDELDYGITSIACPIVLPGYGVVGAVNCSSSTASVEPENFAASRLPHLEATRRQLTEDLSGAHELLRTISAGN